jgi:hypothetical protein
MVNLRVYGVLTNLACFHRSKVGGLRGFNIFFALKYTIEDETNEKTIVKPLLLTDFVK